MDLLGDDLSFALLVLFGMFAVGVHSYNLYGKRVTADANAETHHFLDSLSLRTLGGRHSYIRGFVFYLAVNELIYLTLAFSTLILQQSLYLIGQEKMVGALTADTHINPLYPILASSVIIVASQMKPLSDVENALRRMAHSIAGIPRTLFDVQQRIKALTIEALVERSDTDTQEQTLHELVRNAELLALEVDRVADEAGMPADERSTLRRSLTKMHCLYGWTLGYHGEKIWVDERTMPISTFFQSMKIEKRNLSEVIAKLVSVQRSAPASAPDQPSLKTPVDQWRDVALHCRELENKFSDVLGLMLINKPDADLTAFPSLRKLRSRVNMRDVRPEMNAFGLATLQGLGVATAALFVYLYAENWLKGFARSPSPGGTEVTPLPLQSADAESSAFSFSAVRLPQEDELVRWAAEAGGYINRSVREVMEPALIFLIAVGIALSMRALQRASHRWPARVVHETGPAASASKVRIIRPPSVMNYLYIGAGAYLLSSAAVLLYRYLVLVVTPAMQRSLSFTEAAQLVDFTTFIPEIFLICGSAFVCVWFACAYLDLESWTEALWVHRSAFTMAMLCGLLNLVSALSTTTIYTGWDIIQAFASPALAFGAFFVCYARAMERYQQPEPVQIGLREAITVRRTRRRRARAASSSAETVS